MFEAIKRRLGARELARPSSIASACDVSKQMVLDWIDAGTVEAANLGTDDRPYYQVYVPSVLRHYARRLGVEDETTRRAGR
jgi:hypothetical protein